MSTVIETKSKLIEWGQWLLARPLVIINLSFVIIMMSIFLFLMNKPLDVLQDWSLTISDVKEYRDGNPIFNPGDTLVFNSSSKKLVDADGVTSRVIVCAATSTRTARDIQLDTLPATKPSGINAPRDNAIIIPDVTQFDGLPRDCYLRINICYRDVVLWRDHCESQMTETFTVEERKIDPREIERQIEELRQKIKELESKLSVSVLNQQGETYEA